MAARLCSKCLTEWPNTYPFRRCPTCGCDTTLDHRAPTPDNWEAFEAYYDGWDAKREAQGLISPDLAGIYDARKLARGWAEAVRQLA